MGKVAVITANIGGFDTIKFIPTQTHEFDRYYITDKELTHPMCGLDNRLKAKLYKMMPHMIWPEYDIYIWVDGNVQIKSATFIEGMVKSLDGYDVAISEHPVRSNTDDEANYIIKGVEQKNPYLKSRYNADAIRIEMERYGNIEGLYWCGLFARWNDYGINKSFEWWWKENCLFSNFDQLNFSAMTHRLKLSIVQWGDFYNNPTYSITSHNKIA